MFSIAQRLAWAATRETSIAEDIAYCLVGITGVYLTPHYGEGREAAFMRLQQKIMSHDKLDESILAWRGRGPGLFASSPHEYLRTRGVVPLPPPVRASRQPDFTRARLRISAEVFNIRDINWGRADPPDGTHVVALACRCRSDPDVVPALLLRSANRASSTAGATFYAAGGPYRIVWIDIERISRTLPESICILTRPAARAQGIFFGLYGLCNDPLDVIDTEPRGLWQPIDISRRKMVYHFNHTALMHNHVTIGLRVHCDGQGPVNVVFESNRKRKQFRLVAFKRARKNSSIYGACLRGHRRRNDRPWMPWLVRYNFMREEILDTKHPLQLRSGGFLAGNLLAEAHDEMGFVLVSRIPRNYRKMAQRDRRRMQSRVLNDRTGLPRWFAKLCC